QLGAGMISRGEVGLIVANVGVREGLILDNEFSAIVVMVLVTTLITPPILRALFTQTKARDKQLLVDAMQTESQPDSPKNSEEAD
ncbi:MAG TPA: cation:proton antiporter, partial [Anaerolineales bacterium]|nr:cation:proton antiporter [Anaerolineales bacterium]